MGCGSSSPGETAVEPVCADVAAARATTPDVGSKRSLTTLRSAASLCPARPVCKHGSKCYRSNPEHLAEEAHPFDRDYLKSCREAGVDPEFVSIRKLFEWCDPMGTGKAKKDEVVKVWDKIQGLGENVPAMTDALWDTLDDDGNGHMNFSELAEFTTKFKVNLPLGLDDLFGGVEAGVMRCGVHGCECRCFEVRRRRCKYGAECYQKKADHLAAFCHPCDPEWETAKEAGDAEMCKCGHKKKLHSSAHVAAGAVPYPKYWTSLVDGDKEFNSLVAVTDDDMTRFRKLLEDTYSDVTTRDRHNHTGTWMVPERFQLETVHRNENSRLWRKYVTKKAELLQEREALDLGHGEDVDYPHYTDVKTTVAWQGMGADELEVRVNEWYLFHGTSDSAAHNICQNDFKMRLAGSATGTLYGKGSYLAESITKADEYSKDEHGVFTVLLCRVLGGRVRYCDVKTPNPDELTADCTEGSYDCILGDRAKTSGTYREFVFFDTENIYPEYLLKYQRGPLFKSASHPPGH